MTAPHTAAVHARQADLVSAAGTVAMGCNAALTVGALCGWVDVAGAWWLLGAVGLAVAGMWTGGRWGW
jgi:hypothetical protein